MRTSSGILCIVLRILLHICTSHNENNCNEVRWRSLRRSRPGLRRGRHGARVRRSWRCCGGRGTPRWWPPLRGPTSRRSSRPTHAASLSQSRSERRCLPRSRTRWLSWRRPRPSRSVLLLPRTTRCVEGVTHSFSLARYLAYRAVCFACILNCIIA